MAIPNIGEWVGPEGELGVHIREESQKTLAAYRNQPNNLRADANQEEDTARGGYANRQIFELAQNSADALSNSDGERISIVLTPTHLYCADDGAPIDRDGATALLFSHMSSKRGTDEIGRFGLGFKSVLGVTDAPDFFSRSGSFGFDRDWSADILREIAPDMARYPVLRLAQSIDPRPAMKEHSVLLEMARWAKNIVRLPLKAGAYIRLANQIQKFPAEFLLFVEHVGMLDLLTNEMDAARVIRCDRESDGTLWTLVDGETQTRWMVTKRIHPLTQAAKDDSRSLDNANEVPIYWAAPVDRLNEPGEFWAFFPTLTTSLLAGILNAPWKTNEDRQNLLSGPYNDELIDAAAEMAANTLPRLSTENDPASHLDALPRRHEFGDNQHSNRLRRRLRSILQNSEFVPDQNGRLRTMAAVLYPPRELTSVGQSATSDAFKRWAAYSGRPSAWLNHSGLTRNRLARIAELYDEDEVVINADGSVTLRSLPLPRATIGLWLEALVRNAKARHPSINAATLEPLCEASIAAIQTAALIPESIRRGKYLGEILLTADGHWVLPNPNAVWLSGGYDSDASAVVHPRLEEDPDTLDALKKLGLQPASSTSVFKEYAPSLLARPWFYEEASDADWRKFWNLVRNADSDAAVEIIKIHGDWRDSLRVRTVDGSWRTLFNALLPGRIVPADGSRDGRNAIDVAGFHAKDGALLRRLGAVDAPQPGWQLPNSRRLLFRRDCVARFQNRPEINGTPRESYLEFVNDTTSGPLGVLEALSDEGNVLYTDALLSMPATYADWEMRHKTLRNKYRSMHFPSPAVDVLREHGVIETADGFRPLHEALGDSPNRAVLRKLLSHPNAERIRDAFNLTINAADLLEPVGEDDRIALIDAYPDLESHLEPPQSDFQLIRCDRFAGVAGADATACVIKDGTIYVARRDDERDELQAILNMREIGVPYTAEQILERRTPADIRAARDAVRQCATDEERLLKAAGESVLRSRLPQGLIEILARTKGAALSGVEVAQAAIATFHTGALREYRHALSHLDPPKQWAGRPSAVEFVQSLGFSEEWAGERRVQRDPYIEVDGPYTLPPLHGYQDGVVNNIRDLIRSGGALGERRGMVSMPTGSGKTRVAVQAVVEAIREGELKKGGVLWVADRDELCEQAVEAWRQVWASEGKREARLRISRMWSGQPQPLPTADMHVIVASIQTLYAKTQRQAAAYEFLADFELLVFDEAHRSVAPTFTSVMGELGLTRYRRQSEPLLIGLTATPYRGHDERETERLVNRYGRNRLDSGAFASDEPQSVIRELQKMRVLAQADHDIIPGVVDFDMTPDERRQSEDAPWLPQSVENRIAQDAERTERIIQEYMERVHAVDPDAPALIFATSVEHAQTLAALLTSRGVKARAVSGGTDAAVRRRVVEEFRAGDVKALVNYAVFREGFDAPKTRAIIVARPVYSPNLYFQMVGRGLRGVKNGGNDRCLILNVEDNITNFGRNLAFSELDWLWNQSP